MDPTFLKAVNDRLGHLRALERELRHGVLVGPLLARAEDDATWRGPLRLAFTGWLQALNGYVRHQLPDGIAAVIASIQSWLNEQEAARLTQLAGGAMWQESPSTAPRPVAWAMPQPPPFAMNLFGARGEIWIDPERLDSLANNLGQVADGFDAFGRSVRDAIEPLRLPAGPPLASPMSRAGGGIPVDAAPAVGWPGAYQAVSRDLRAALVDLVDRAAQVRRANAVGDGPPGILRPPAGPPAPSQAATLAQAATACLADRATGPGRQPNQAKEADPVSVSTGNYLLETLDILVSGGPGDGMSFGRTYNSLDAARPGDCGFGWSHTFDINLAPTSTGVTIRYGDGREEHVAAANARVRTLTDGYEFTTPTRDVWRFDLDGRLTVLTDPSSNRWTLRRSDGGTLAAVRDPAGREVRFDTDGDGRIVGATDPLDRTWRYDYDTSGDLVAATDPAGGVWRYTYDTGHHLTTVTDPDGGLVIENVYDTAGRVTVQVDSAGARWSYRYGADRTVTTDPLGRERIYGVDDRFRTTSLADPSGAITRLTWDDDSHLVAVVDEAGRSWRFTYGEHGSVTRAVGPDEGTVRYEFDDRHNLVAVIGTDGSRLTVGYDDADRPVTVTSPGGAATSLRWRPDGLPLSVTDENGSTEHFVYEPDGRLAGLVDPLGITTHVTTDAAGQILSEAHPDGATTSFEWDLSGRLAGVTDPLGGQWRYAYDGTGRLASVSDALGRTTRYTWDARGLLVSVTDPLERTTTFAYDLARRLTEKVDGRNVRVTYSWDAADRLVAVEPEDGPASRFTYDVVGRLLTMTDATGTTTFTHDLAGRPVREEHDPSGVALVHAYDTMGRRRRLSLERHREEVAVWAYDYDADGRLVTVTDPTGGRTTLTCDPAGQLVEVRHPNGVVSEWQHDAAGQVVDLSHTAPGGDRLAAWSFRYDPEGNRIAAGSVRYAYDDLDRLTGVTDDAGRSTRFAYDALGNRTVAGDSTLAYDEASQILSDGAYAYEHDAAGNLVSRRPLGGGPGAVGFSWDGLGRLLAIDVDGASTAFDYDALGRRAVRRDGGGVTRRIFDGANVLEERGDDGAVFETVAGLTVLNRINADGPAEYLHPDGNANVAWFTDATGQPVQGPQLGSWGEPLGGRPADGVGGFAGTIGVRGGVADLWEMRARFYDPHLGRFLSPDPWPATLPGPATLNRYAYALNDPISLLDPSGLFCWTGKNDAGKCRGVRDVAKRVSEPLKMVSTVATVVAVTAVGLTVVCPPCAVATLPIAGSLQTIAAVSRGVAFGAGLTSTLIECSEKIVSFDCAVGAVTMAVGAGAGGQIERGVTRLAGSRVMAASPENVGQFAAGIFDIFSEGVSGAIDNVRK